MENHLASCHCCGLIQSIPPGAENSDEMGGYVAVCSRCHTRLKHTSTRRNRLTQALTFSAIVFYIPAMTLPMLYIERLGHASADSLLSGVTTLWSRGHWLIGAVVLLFSVLLPPLKLIALAILSSRSMILRHSHRAVIYQLVEFVGRWGMLDVMLVAVLVAFVKLGDLVEIHPGNGLIAFVALVLCSLLASFAFNPKLMWTEQ